MRRRALLGSLQENKEGIKFPITLKTGQDMTTLYPLFVSFLKDNGDLIDSNFEAYEYYTENVYNDIVIESKNFEIAHIESVSMRKIRNVNYLYFYEYSSYGAWYFYCTENDLILREYDDR